MWGNCSNRLCQLLRNWKRMNMIFKNPSQMFYKIDALKYFGKFSWKDIRAVILLKIDSSNGVFLWILRDFWELFFYRTPLDGCFCIFSFALLFFLPPNKQMETESFLFLNMFITSFELDDYHKFYFIKSPSIKYCVFQAWIAHPKVGPSLPYSFYSVRRNKWSSSCS